jgi:hypothetical protein
VGLLRTDDAPFLVERRAARRVQVTCAANFRTLMGESAGTLLDLSKTGARIQLVDPPQPGTTGVLRWSRHEAICSVVWSTDDACGVSFDTAIDDAAVSESTRLNRVVEQPIAVVNNIAPGRKRSARAAPESIPPRAESEDSWSWQIRLSRPRASLGSKSRKPLVAAEEMFFYGSPLAHVLAYESNLLSSRG